MFKRKATEELTRDNWDEEDEQSKEFGSFQKASVDDLKGRIIKQAKRRIVNDKSIFSGFTGFVGNNQQSKKFSFSANLANSDERQAITFLSKPDPRSDVKSNFPFMSNIFCNKINESSPNFEDDINFSLVKKFDNKVESSSSFEKKPISPHSSVKTTEAVSVSENKNKLNELSRKLKKTVGEEEYGKNCEKSKNNDGSERTPDDVFVQKLRSLNLLCTEWIIKYLNENLSYILTPIFDDYKKYLNQFREERQRANSSNKRMKSSDDYSAEIKPKNKTSSFSTPFNAPDFKENLNKLSFEKNFFTPPVQKPIENKPGFQFSDPAAGKNANLKFFTTVLENKDIGSGNCFDLTSNINESSFFKFGNESKSCTKPESNSEPEIKTQSFFSFGLNKAPTTSNVFGQNTAAANNGMNSKDDDENELPPIKEDILITEEGSIYEKKCKVFIKKNGNFVDHGIGFLFLKLVGGERKCQLIVRANNKLATIILNVLLTTGVPTQLMGKNNVMIICCPTLLAKPTSVLLKVKTEEDAKDLLNVLNKHKN